MSLLTINDKHTTRRGFGDVNRKIQDAIVAVTDEN